MVSISRGKLYLIGGNPRAYKQNVRFTEENLNRCFTDEPGSSYESQRAQEIMQILQECDAALDIHQQTIDEVMAVCEGENSRALARQLEVPLVITSAEGMNLYSVDGYMDRIGKTAVCIEAGNFLQKDQLGNLEYAFRQALRFLVSQGQLSLPKYALQSIATQPLEIETCDEYRTLNGFQLDDTIQQLQPITTGMLLGMDGEKEVRCRPEWDGCLIAFYSRFQPKPGEEAFYINRLLKRSE